MANIVIAGANRGIGLALVKAYLQDGNRVFALCRNPAAATELAALVVRAGNQLSVHSLDMSQGDSIDGVGSELGDVPVDVLVNVAGVIGGRIDSMLAQRFSEDDFTQWRQAFEVMVIGPFRLTQALLPNLQAAKGKVMTISSQIAASTWEQGGMYAYAATKAAVNRMMRSLATDLQSADVIVATVHPGYVQTDMGGPNAEITPQESAEGIKAVIAGLDIQDSGDFFKWNGQRHDW